MARKRTAETNEGIRGEPSVKIFDRNMHDKGGSSVDSIIKVGITKGNVLEIITAIPLTKVESSILFVSTITLGQNRCRAEKPSVYAA